MKALEQLCRGSFDDIIQHCIRAWCFAAGEPAYAFIKGHLILYAIMQPGSLFKLGSLCFQDKRVNCGSRFKVFLKGPRVVMGCLLGEVFASFGSGTRVPEFAGRVAVNVVLNAFWVCGDLTVNVQDLECVPKGVLGTSSEYFVAKFLI